MANITFVNTAPVAGLSFNPGIEEVLDSTPTLGTFNANLFEVINNNPGALNGFKVQFTSNVNGVGDFNYLFSPNAPLQPFGTITGITVRAPNGTVILEVTPGTTGYGDQKLDHFFTTLTDPSTVNGAISALDTLLSKTNLIQGSSFNDHATILGLNGSQVHGGLGNDVLSSPDKFRIAELSGGAGDDVIRLNDGEFKIHGANADGGGGAGETNTLEIVGARGGSTTASVANVTDIDVLRFTDLDAALPPSSSDAPNLTVYFLASDVGPGGLSSTLAVHGSTTASPFSSESILVRVPTDEAATTGVRVDLSGWTFTDWDSRQNNVHIETNGAKKPLNDVVIGTSVSDSIVTFAGDDVLRGGGGADYLGGGVGNDIFVYGTHEAAAQEYVDGGDYEGPKGIDTVLVLGDNDFTTTELSGVEQLAFGGAATAVFNQYFAGDQGIKTVIGDGNANTLAIRMETSAFGPPAIDLSNLGFAAWSNNDVVSIVGTNSLDTISGSSQGDVINGGLGSDNLQGNGGADAFVFDSLRNGVDHIADFHRKEGDTIQLDRSVFTKLKPGDLRKSAFEFGHDAETRKDHILYDKKDGVIRYDDDGIGKHKAVIIGILDDAASLKAGDILVI